MDLIVVHCVQVKMLQVSSKLFLSAKPAQKETCMFKHNHSAQYFNKINVDAIGNQVWEALAL